MKASTHGVLFTIGFSSGWQAHSQGLALYACVSQESRVVLSCSLAEPLSPVTWRDTLAEPREKWLEMLGLLPLPKRTPLLWVGVCRLPSILSNHSHECTTK